MINRQPHRTPATLHLPRTPSPPLPPVDPASRPPLAINGDDEAWAAWEAHVDAGRIGGR